jgi:hypothetical protein
VRSPQSAANDTVSSTFNATGELSARCSAHQTVPTVPEPDHANQAVTTVDDPIGFRFTHEVTVGPRLRGFVYIIDAAL